MPDGLTGLTGFPQKLLYVRVVKLFLKKCRQTRQFLDKPVSRVAALGHR
jgi:hypothetical protein